MERTKLKDRILPDYTRGEEITNMVTHTIGAALGVVMLVICVVTAAKHGNIPGVVGSAIYGTSLIVLYSMSAIYHGLNDGMGKRVMQVLDHCTIYFLIAGTYTPITLSAIRRISPAFGWTIFGIVWGFSALGVTFTAIDLKKYSRLSMICYLAIGWCIIVAIRPTILALTLNGLMWILGGGICYSIGAILYACGKRHRYVHSVFHVFVLAGSILQFFGIVFYAI